MTFKNPHKKGGLFDGASPLVFEMAKNLRKNMTEAENALWLRLRGFKGLKFRRQHPIGIYIADFYCHALKLIIEVDGSIHDKPEVIENDETRQRDLESLNYHVLRFTNSLVLKNIEDVLNNIDRYIGNIIELQKLNASSKDGV